AYLFIADIDPLRCSKKRTTDGDGSGSKVACAQLDGAIASAPASRDTRSLEQAMTLATTAPVRGRMRPLYRHVTRRAPDEAPVRLASRASKRRRPRGRRASARGSGRGERSPLVRAFGAMRRDRSRCPVRVRGGPLSWQVNGGATDEQWREERRCRIP